MERFASPDMSFLIDGCSPGDLLKIGFQQHIALGTSYSSYLINQTGLLPRIFDRSACYIRATDVPRAQLSAMAFLDGLYPNSSGSGSLNISVCPRNRCKIRPPFEMSRELRNLWRDFTVSSQFLSRFQSSRRFFSNLADNLSIVLTTANWNDFVDFVVVNHCSANASWASDDLFERALADHCFIMTDFYRLNPFLVGGSIMSELLMEADSFLNGETDRKFILYGAHDSSIMSILAVLGVYPEFTVPYRSHLLMELWQTDSTYVRFSLNGESVSIFNSTDVVPYGFFADSVSKLNKFSA